MAGMLKKYEYVLSVVLITMITFPVRLLTFHLSLFTFRISMLMSHRS